MKWQTGLILLASLIIGYLLWQNWTNQKTIQSLQITSQKKVVDTLQIETEKKVTEWKTQKVISEKIVDKWHNIHDTIIKRDTLLVECQEDIFSLDTSIKKCDTALNVCLKLNEAQSELKKSLEKQNKNQKKIGFLKIIGAVIVGAAAQKAIDK